MAAFGCSLRAKLLSHEWHAGLVILPVVECDLAVTPLLSESLALAIPKSHPLAKSQKVSLANLADMPLILPPRRFNPHFHDHLVSRLRATGVAPVFAHEITNPHESLHLVSEGLGIAIAQLSVLQSASRNIVVKTFADPNLAVETAIAFRRGDDSSALRLFIEAVTHTRDQYLEQQGRRIEISA